MHEEDEVDKILICLIILHSLYLGHVVTVSNVEGLLVHKVFAEEMLVLDTVLNMHTWLPIHPFVPRTFATEFMAMPFTHTGVTATFVGEHAGEWNLGSPNGIANMNSGQKCTVAYHVTLCLIKAQILTMSILGFPLLRLHPARIWRDGTRFRLDFLACLLDHITAKLNSNPPVSNNGRRVAPSDRLDSPIRPVAGGVRAITTALTLLELDRFTPFRAKQNANVQDTIEVFYDMYLRLTNRDARSLDLQSLLGEDETYQPFMVSTSNCLVEPFAPFFVQIHNQYVKWNKVVIVEPVQNDEILPTPKLQPFVGPPKIQYWKKKPKEPSSGDQLQEELPIPGVSSDVHAAPVNDTRSASMRPPSQATRAPRSRAQQPRTGPSSAAERTIRPIVTPNPLSQVTRAARARPRTTAATPRVPASQSTQTPVVGLETMNNVSTQETYILDVDYDMMNTCASTYYDG